MALSCDYRIISNSGNYKIGLNETLLVCIQLLQYVTNNLSFVI